MKTLAQEVLAEAQKQALEVKVLPYAVGKQLVADVAQKFAGGAHNWLWEQFKDAGYYAADDGWQKLQTFPAHIAPLLFFNETDTETVIRFNTFRDVVRVVAECRSFEFYVTNTHVDFVISFNHHDMLAGVGIAASWVNAISGA